MNVDSPEFERNMWLEAIASRIQDMLSSHPEIDKESADLVVDAVIAGLTAHPKLLGRWQDGNSFIEHSYFDEDGEVNTKLGALRSATKVSYKLPNGRRYSISGPFFNAKRTRNNG